MGVNIEQSAQGTSVHFQSRGRLVGCGSSRTAKVRPQQKSPNPLCSI